MHDRMREYTIESMESSKRALRNVPTRSDARTFVAVRELCGWLHAYGPSGEDLSMH
eukprot:SAG11_NODE_622_length_8164_cov_2.208308_2_plen_56_part_00